MPKTTCFSTYAQEQKLGRHGFVNKNGNTAIKVRRVRNSGEAVNQPAVSFSNLSLLPLGLRTTRAQPSLARNSVPVSGLLS